MIVVGCGAVAQTLYAPALDAVQRAGEIQVVGIVDPSETRRAGMLKRFPEAVAHSNLAFCRLGAQNLVVIATPPKLHAEQSVHALRQGAAVLCEKPMAASSAEAEAMIQAARTSGVVLAVGIFRRFFPAFEALKQVFYNKPFGELQDFTIHEGGKFGWGAASDSYFRLDQTLGGVLFDLGVYIVDLLLWWLGEPASFTYEDDAMGGLEANCRLHIAYRTGGRGMVRLSRDWETQNRYVFRFEAATVIYKVGQANRLSVSVNGVPFVLCGELMMSGNGQDAVDSPTRTWPQSFTEQIRNVVAAMRGRQELRVPGAEAICSLRFIESCYRTRTLMKMPWLTREETDTALELARVDR
ncbi:MAG: Gfo/Idh/MocA family oxidoreductase [Vicinamibacterales bacterium]